MKSLNKDTTGISPLKDNGTLHTDSKTKAEILLNQFKSVFTKENLEQTPNLPPENKSPQMSPIKITVKGVEQTVERHQPKWSPRPWQHTSSNPERNGPYNSTHTDNHLPEIIRHWHTPIRLAQSTHRSNIQEKRQNNSIKLPPCLTHQYTMQNPSTHHIKISP